MRPVYGLLCEQLTLLKWPACAVDHWWHHATAVFMEANMATATGNVGLYGLMLNTVCGGSRQICERVISRRRKRRKKIHILLMALCGAIAATSVQRSIWMRRRSQEWWDWDVAGYTEQDFFQKPHCPSTGHLLHCCPPCLFWLCSWLSLAPACCKLFFNQLDMSFICKTVQRGSEWRQSRIKCSD